MQLPYDTLISVEIGQNLFSFPLCFCFSFTRGFLGGEWRTVTEGEVAIYIYPIQFSCPSK
jgi:hypothetical protein